MNTIERIANALWVSGHRAEYLLFRKLISIIPKALIQHWEQKL